MIERINIKTDCQKNLTLTFFLQIIVSFHRINCHVKFGFEKDTHLENCLVKCKLFQSDRKEKIQNDTKMAGQKDKNTLTFYLNNLNFHHVSCFILFSLDGRTLFET